MRPANYGIHRGNTSIITIDMPSDADYTEVDSTRIRATVWQEYGNKVTRENADVSVRDGYFFIYLTQDETLSFDATRGNKVYKQVKWADTYGNVLQTARQEEALFDTGDEQTI
jgi:hypothetical protein